MIFILGTACIEKLCFSIHDYCLFTNKKGIRNVVINNKSSTFTINKDIYYEFIFVFFLTYIFYYSLNFILNKYVESYNKINPPHKKMYVIKNYIKSFYLAGLCFTLPYYITGQYDIYFIQRCCIYYIMNDIIGLLLVKKLPTTTIIHHLSTSLCGLCIFMKNNDNLDLITLIVLYAIFSSITFLVNFYLGFRVHSTNIIYKYYLSNIALYIYFFSCLINWTLQIYLFPSIVYIIPFWQSILYIAFIYSVVKDDIILMKWLYNDKCIKN
jgi:hypothetical protein